MGASLANIGKFKFDTTEWAMLEAQKKTVDDILQEIKVNKANADLISGPVYSELPLTERAGMTIPERHAAILAEEQRQRDARQLDSEIKYSRLSLLDAAMFTGGRAARGSGSPDNYGFFDVNDSDDDAAFSRLKSYRDSDSIQAQNAFLDSLEIMRAFSFEQQQAVNDSNAINRIPNVMTDVTGQELLRAIRELAREFKVNIEFRD